VVGGLPELEVGTLLAAQAIGGIALNPLWGWWGDRRGKSSLLKALAITAAVSPLLAIALPALPLSPAATLAGYALVFFFVGASASGEIIGDLGYLMEISPDHRRPEYSGYMNALVAPSRLLPFVAGLALEVVSFPVLFAVALAAALVGRLAVLRSLEASHPAR
jgi:MFS family permease